MHPARDGLKGLTHHTTDEIKRGDWTIDARKYFPKKP